MPFSDQSGIGAIELGLRWAELSFDSDSPVNLFSSSLSPVNIPGEAQRPQTVPRASR